jgi:hypothetical protein
VGGHVKRRTKLVDGGLEVGLLFKFWQVHMANYWRDYKILLAICFSNLPNHKIWQVSFDKLLEMLSCKKINQSNNLTRDMYEHSHAIKERD